MIEKASSRCRRDEAKRNADGHRQNKCNESERQRWPDALSNQFDDRTLEKIEAPRSPWNNAGSPASELFVQRLIETESAVFARPLQYPRRPPRSPPPGRRGTSAAKETRRTPRLRQRGLWRPFAGRCNQAFLTPCAARSRGSRLSLKRNSVGKPRNHTTANGNSAQAKLSIIWPLHEVYR